MFGFTHDEMEPVGEPDRQSDENTITLVILAHLLAFAGLMWWFG